MAAIIDSAGIKIDTLSDAISDLSILYKSIYGEDINIDSDTTDGQLIAIISKMYTDLQENSVLTYNAFDPDSASGAQLRRLLKLCGIVDSGATQSKVDVNITVDAPITLDAGYTLEDTLKQKWVIAESINLEIGTTLVGFVSDTWGSVSASANTITKQVTIVLGVVSVNNPAIATIGRDEKTDVELRRQRKQSVSLPSQNTIDGLRAKLLSINGVKDAIVHENSTFVYDAVKDLNAKTIWAIVDGGSHEDITSVMDLDRGTGVDMKGLISESISSNQLRNDGTFRIYTNYINYDRPTEVPLFIKFDVTLKEGETYIDLEQIKNSLLTKEYYIAESGIVTELYSYIYPANTNFIATDLQISIDDITYASDKLLAGYGEKFIITTANILITEV